MRAIGTLVVVALAILFAHGSGNPSNHPHQYLGAAEVAHIKGVERVYSLCTKAHYETNGASERACGNAQEETGTEYLCSAHGDYCWVEFTGIYGNDW